MCALSLSCFRISFNHLTQSHNNFHNNAFQKDKRNERDCEGERNYTTSTTTLILTHTQTHFSVVVSTSNESKKYRMCIWYNYLLGVGSWFLLASPFRIYNGLRNLLSSISLKGFRVLHGGFFRIKNGSLEFCSWLG